MPQGIKVAVPQLCLQSCGERSKKRTQKLEVELHTNLAQIGTTLHVMSTSRWLGDWTWKRLKRVNLNELQFFRQKEFMRLVSNILIELWLSDAFSVRSIQKPLCFLCENANAILRTVQNGISCAMGKKPLWLKINPECWSYLLNIWRGLVRSTQNQFGQQK